VRNKNAGFHSVALVHDDGIARAIDVPVSFGRGFRPTFSAVDALGVTHAFAFSRLVDGDVELIANGNPSTVARFRRATNACPAQTRNVWGRARERLITPSFAVKERPLMDARVRTDLQNNLTIVVGKEVRTPVVDSSGRIFFPCVPFGKFLLRDTSLANRYTEHHRGQIPNPQLTQFYFTRYGVRFDAPVQSVTVNFTHVLPRPVGAQPELIAAYFGDGATTTGDLSEPLPAERATAVTAKFRIPDFGENPNKSSMVFYQRLYTNFPGVEEAAVVAAKGSGEYNLRSPAITVDLDSTSKQSVNVNWNVAAFETALGRDHAASRAYAGTSLATFSNKVGRPYGQTLLWLTKPTTARVTGTAEIVSLPKDFTYFEVVNIGQTLQLSGGVTATREYFTSRETGVASTLSLAPLLGKVRNVRINGRPTTGPLSGLGTTMKITWDAPALGTVTGYTVYIRDVSGAEESHDAEVKLGAAQRELTLRPEWVSSSMVFTVRAEYCKPSVRLKRPDMLCGEEAYVDELTDVVKP
jgi:hypothetical protein